VTFNKKLFYNLGNKLTAIPVKEAIVVIDILYKPNKIIDVGDAIKLPIAERDLLLSLPTKQQLRGNA
jgi:hypothetical protein